MRMGVLLQSLFGFSNELFNKEPFEDLLDEVAQAGVQCIEIGMSNKDSHWNNPGRLLEDEKKLRKFTEAISRKGLEVSALNGAGNPLHPVEKIRKEATEELRKTILLAEKLKVGRVIAFSGCPGASQNSDHPNWIVYPFGSNEEVLKWQWEKVAIPFWREQEEFAREHDVRICLELHPCTLTYNCKTLLQLRDATGKNLGANLDPSHFFWQQIDPIRVLHELGEAVFHVHGKDTAIDTVNTSKNGVLDPKPFAEKARRSWIFRTVGYGHSLDFWKKFVNTLKLIGYDDVVSIEQEDPLFSFKDGFRRGAKFLTEVFDS